MRWILLMLGAFGLFTISPAPTLPEFPRREPLQIQNAPRVSALAGQLAFQQRCGSCHSEKPTRDQRALGVSTLMKMSPEAIYSALTTGAMVAQSQGLTDEQKRSIALYLSGRLVGAGDAGDAKRMTGHCPRNAPVADLSARPSWNGWGAGPSNTRFQLSRQAKLSVDQVPRLKLKWAFGFPGGASAYSQPTVAAGHVFVGSDGGYVYSLNADSGCIYWSYRAQAGVRSAISIGPVEGQGAAKYAIYFADIKTNVYALDALTGKSLWTTHVDDHRMAQITGSPTLEGGRLYVPVSASEELVAGNEDYSCCTFRGSVVALGANTGRQIWKSYVIPDEPKPTKKNPNGVQLFAPAGASVWNAPTIDVKGQKVYVGTGDAETEPAPKTSDAIVALDIDSGRIRWSFQGNENDVWMAGCEPNRRSAACPEGEMGPDWDFGSSAMLQTLPSGRRILVIPSKSGTVFAFDPDRNGAFLWKINLARKRPSVRGEIVFGGAADEQNAYFALTEGGMAAVGLKDGALKWFTPLVASGVTGVDAGQTAAVTAIPGVAFVGGMDGKLHALSTKDGHILWEFNTVREFTTVNGVAAQGGSMGGPGPTVAGGMLYVGSGYTVLGGTPGNVLLAFAPK
jgi:polyvinyl alcohol dehydrogenase (cytochrome)